MQRAGIEGILGIRIRSGVLHVEPCIPRHWPRFEATIAWRSARYRITVENTGGSGRGVTSLKLDGAGLAAGVPLALVDDGATHTVEIALA
jgi:cyclic beta-1,2-glucan synthetase